jgi:ABC-type uncharacterized transport system permease subunit
MGHRVSRIKARRESGRLAAVVAAGAVVLASLPTAGFALGALVLSRAFWRFALRYYTSASS